jgi:ABC-type oligopeptide transport system substrate-binding subunit
MKYYSGMTCGASIKSLIFAFYSSKPGMIAAAASRATDITTNYTAADVPDLLKHKSKFKTHVDPSFTFEHIELNVDKQYKGKPNPLGNASVRQALALALDKYGLIRSALGLSQAQAKQIIAWTPWVNTPTLVQPFTDKKINGQWDPLAKKYVTPGSGKALSDAQKLLARTPFAGGFTLDGFTTQGNPVRQAQFAVMAASWAKLKVTFVPNYIPTSKLFAEYESGGLFQRGEFQVAMFGFTGPPDPDSLKYNLQSKYIDREQTTHNSINGNYSGIHDKIIDRGFDVAARSLSKSVRAKEYAAIQKQMDQQAYWIGLFFRPTIATDDGKVRNFSTNPTTAPQWNAYAWKVAAAS